MFTNDIEENTEILRELLRSLPPSQRGKAQKAAATIEKCVMGLRKDNPGCGATALGTAFAVHMIAGKLMEDAKEGKHDGLIKLIS
jgi:hypothetical protein